jgi:IS1 family transposase
MEDHSREFNDEYVQQIEATAVQMDEHYRYVKSKDEPFWEVTALEPQSRLVIGFVGGRRDQRLIKELRQNTKSRLCEPTDLVLMTDGARSYEALFVSVFDQPYRSARQGDRGRFAKVRHRINRDLAHLQVIKQRHRGRMVEVSCRVAHGSYKRVNRELERLAYKAPNLCTIERQNGRPEG